MSRIGKRPVPLPGGVTATAASANGSTSQPPIRSVHVKPDKMTIRISGTNAEENRMACRFASR